MGAVVVRARTARGRPKNRTDGRGAAIVRGVLSDRLEKALPAVEAAVNQALDGVRRRGVPPEAFAGELALAVIQNVQVALFPEEFGVTAFDGLVPAGGLPRAGAGREEGYARLLLAVAGAG